LNFKLGSEHEEYRWSKAEHFEYEKEITERLVDARFRFAVASAHLDNTLYPERARLEALIAADRKLVAETEDAMALATRERNQAQETYERNCDEHDLTMDAIKECVELLEGLKGGSASFVQISKAQRNIKRLAQRLQVSKTWGHLAKVLVNMVQDFASGAAVDKVLGLFFDL